MKNKAAALPLVLSLLSTNASADLSDNDKLGIGLTIFSAVLEHNNDKKHKQEADAKIDTLDYTEVYNDKDCDKKYLEVLTAEQLKSKKDWVLDVANKVKQHCDTAIENNRARIADERRLVELEAQLAAKRQKEQQAKQAAAQAEQAHQQQKNELSEKRKKYNEYQATLKLKKDSLSKSTLSTWQPVYDAFYEVAMRQARSLSALATTPEKLAAAQKLVEIQSPVSKQLSTCYQINMAYMYPDAPLHHTKRIGTAIKTENRFYMPKGYSEGLSSASIGCSLYGVEPSS